MNPLPQTQETSFTQKETRMSLYAGTLCAFRSGGVSEDCP